MIADCNRRATEDWLARRYGAAAVSEAVRRADWCLKKKNVGAYEAWMGLALIFAKRRREPDQAAPKRRSS